MDDLVLTGVSGGTYGFTDFDYDYGSFTATWTLDGSIGADRLTLDLSDSVSDLSGNALDGEWQDAVSEYNSGDSTAGGDFQFSINVLPGDLNVDDQVNRADFATQVRNLGVSSGATIEDGDLDGDGQLTLVDLALLRGSMGDELPPQASPAAVIAAENVPALLATGEDVLSPTRSDREGRFAPRRHRTLSRPLRFDPAVIDTVLVEADETLRASRRTRRQLRASGRSQRSGHDAIFTSLDY